MINEAEKTGAEAVQGAAEQSAPETAAEEMPAGTGDAILAAFNGEAGRTQPEAEEAQEEPAVPETPEITEPPEPPETADAAEKPPRDWEAEWGALAKEHPEVIGAKLPDELFRACVASDRPVVQVYEAFMLKNARGELEKYREEAQSELTSVKAEMEKLRAENALLRRNAETASRAPVKASTGMAADTGPEDPFLRAFNRY